MDDRGMVEYEGLRGGHLGGQSGAHGTFVLQGESHGVLAVPGGSDDSLDRGNSHSQSRGNRRRSGQGSNDVNPCGDNKGREARSGTSTSLTGGDPVEEGFETGDVGGRPSSEVSGQRADEGREDAQGRAEGGACSGGCASG
jgi:hypothetical protein